MVEYIDRTHQKRPDSRTTRSRTLLSGSFCMLGAALTPRYIARGLAFAGLVVALHTLAHLEGKGFSGAVAAPVLGSLNPATSNRNALLGRVRHDASALLEMTGRDVVALLDQPTLTWHEAPTVFWQYQSEDCVLDIYMASMDDDVGTAPVVHFEERARSIDTPQGACAGILAARL